MTTLILTLLINFTEYRTVTLQVDGTEQCTVSKTEIPKAYGAYGMADNAHIEVTSAVCVDGETGNVF